jgi:hypothetical protein
MPQTFRSRSSHIAKGVAEARTPHPKITGVTYKELASYVMRSLHPNANIYILWVWMFLDVPERWEAGVELGFGLLELINYDLGGNNKVEPGKMHGGVLEYCAET